MRKLFIVLEMIKFEHTVFALPFAFLGAFLAAGDFPGWSVTLWIVLAMMGARSAAMAFNRVVDRRYDALNPRTAGRPLPRGLLSRGFVMAFVVAASALFFLAAWKLNPLALALSPMALAVILIYSYTKRFTSLSHLFLGLALGMAPMGGWVAVTGGLDIPPLYLSGAVLLWVAGFDIIYACQDVEFDRRVDLYSLPRKLGVKRALLLSRLLHVAMVILLGMSFSFFPLSPVSWFGLLVVAVALIYEQRLVSPSNLSRVNAAFFTVNGVISVALFLFIGLDLCLYAWEKY